MLKDQDYILLVLNCLKYRKKALFQKDTWLKTISPSNLIYFHVIGNPNLDTEYAFDSNDKVLWVKCEDDYNSLPKKVIKAYWAISQEYNFKYVFKTDDDQALLKDNFFSSLIKVLDYKYTSTNTNRVHYGGYIVDVKKTHISKYYEIHPELPSNLVVNQCKYCSGRFYLLSSEAITNLLNNEKACLVNEEYLEDYAIGYHLSEEYKRTIMFIDTNVYFKDANI